jgi:hypothetical protein
MINYLIALILSAYHASPLAFWGGALVIGFSAFALLMLLGLCRAAGEADDWADDTLAQFQAERT